MNVMRKRTEQSITLTKSWGDGVIDGLVISNCTDFAFVGQYCGDLSRGEAGKP